MLTVMAKFENIFFEVVNVMETTLVKLKKEICNVLARYDLLVENI